MATNTDGREEIKPVAPTEQTKWRDPSLVGKYMVDPKTGLAGLFRSPDNGETWVLTDTVYGHVYNQDEVDNIWDNGAAHKVADEIKSATADLPNVRKQADSAVKFAESAIAASKVNSDAIVAQSSAVVEAKSAMDSATAEIQQLKANAASDVAQIEATIAEVQVGVNQAKSANESAVQAVQAELKSTSDAMDKVKKQLDEVGTSLDTYAKSAAEQGHDITVIKQKQGQFEADFASVQGNVNQIQADIKGLRQNVKDNQGNIATLLTSADKLQASMKDAQNNISNLLLTASEYEQTFKDQDGRLSKVEQTATEHTSELADTKGDLDKVTQKANALQLLLSDAQKNINNIKVDAQGLHQTLTGQSNQLASLNVTLNNLDSKYSGITGDLQSKQTSLSTEQQQTKDVLLRKADKSEVDNVKGTVNQVSAEQKVMADQINQKVSSVEYQTLKDKVNEIQVGTSNLLHHTDTFEGWHKGSSVSISSEKYLNGSVAILNNSGSGGNALDSVLDVTNDEKYITWTVYAKADVAGDKLHTELWGGGGYTDQPLTTKWQRYKFAGNHADSNHNFYLWGVTGNKGKIYVALPFAVIGNAIGTWSTNPGDTITSINKNTTAIDENSKLISLMAKQTDVDNIKGTAQQLSARLDVMAGEVKSKVDETKVNNIVDGKGYATTSTVQSLITQKAGTINESITNLDAKYRNIDGVNLVHNSGFHNVTIDELKNSGWYINDGIWINKAGGPNKNGSIVLDYRNGTQGTTLDMTQTLQLEPNTDYTLSLHVLFAETAAGKSFDAWTYFVEHDASGRNVNPYVDNGHPMANNYDRNQNTRTFHTTKNTHSGVLYLRANPGTKVELEEVKLERGKVESNTAWTPAPSDNATVTQIQSITASIDGVQSNVTNLKNDTSSKITQLSNTIQSKVSSSNFNSKITQLANDINLRVTKGDLLSQINLTAGNTLIQSNKIYLDSSSVVFSGRAFIPSAAISELDADKLTFYGNGSKASIGASVAQYDQDAIKSTINLQYQGGFEIHSSNQLGSILTMHDNTVRLASRSQTFSAGSGKPLDQQYSGFWAGSNYALINAVDSEGKTTGWSIGPSNSNGYRAYLYDSSTSVQPNFGVGIGTQRFDVYAGGAGLYLGPDKAELRDKSYTTIHSDTQTYIEGGNEQIYIHDGEVCIGMPGHESDKTSVHLRVFGWADFNGWMNVMGLSQTSLLSTKTRIEPLDTREALDKIMAANVETYQFKSDVAEGKTKRHASVIIDDVHDISQYYTPEEFISENRKGRDDGDIVGYLMGAVQELKKQLDKVKEKINYE
ncbi:chromosome partitioning protein ParA [Lactobacillus reuteri]|uniref:Chromosome partitioning protein ParA n=1 Tax=Limosilactobacillus reuteri TaxID=1598 RepID=A0A6L5P1T9_LIMRT|nr:tail fiber domain-containing protein [Limosilactobacillus reuteri]MRH08434.1 chromosome partitioning protein ParA [Limosilactobacillus reuteri]